MLFIGIVYGWRKYKVHSGAHAPTTVHVVAVSELILVIVSWFFCPPMIDSHCSEFTSDFFIIGRSVIRDRGPRSRSRGRVIKWPNATDMCQILLLYSLL